MGGPLALQCAGGSSARAKAVNCDDARDATSSIGHFVRLDDREYSSQGGRYAGTVGVTGLARLGAAVAAARTQARVYLSCHDLIVVVRPDLGVA